MRASETSRFRLFIAADTPNSLQAIANLTAICLQYLPGRYAIEIVDVLLEPQRAMADGIFMTPTLVRVSPLPTRTIVGTLADRSTVARALGLETQAA